MTTQTQPVDHGLNVAGPLLRAGVPVITKGLLAFVLDGAGSAPTTGDKKAYASVPYNCTITKWRILPDASGSCVIDIWKDAYANFPPANADSITASAKPTVSAAIKAESTSLTGWTTNLDEGDVLTAEVESASGMTVVRLELFIVSR